MDSNLDMLDRKLVSTLTDNGRLSVGAIAKKLEVTNPTVGSRLKRLIQSGVLRVAGLINPFATKGLTVALLGLSLQHHQQLDTKLEEISALPPVTWAAVVTGRYDIIVEVVITHEITGLYDFVTKDLPKVGGINTSETFVVMRAKRKWIYLPEKLEGWRSI